MFPPPLNTVHFTGHGLFLATMVSNLAAFYLSLEPHLESGLRMFVLVLAAFLSYRHIRATYQRRKLRQPTRRRSYLPALLSLMAGFFISLALFALLTGCAHSQAGLDRELAIQTGITNALARFDHNAAPLLPPPYGDLAHVLALAGTAATLLWQKSTHNRVNALQAAPPKGSVAVPIVVKP